MAKHLRFIPLLAAAAVLASAATSVTSASDTSVIPDGSTVTTVSPPAPGSSANELAALSPAVEQYAEQFGLSFDDAVKDLQLEAVLAQYATELRATSGFAGFKLERTESGLVGVLAVTDPAFPSLPPELPIRVIEARVSEADRLSFGEGVTSSLRNAGHDVVATTYDPFEDEIVVWTQPADGATGPEAEAILTAARGILDASFPGISVRVDAALAGSVNYGGRKLAIPGRFLWFWPQDSNRCTTAWGVSKQIGGQWHYGYLTAGHCRKIGGPGWEVRIGASEQNIYPVTHYYNQRLGNYRDRVIMEAGGSTYLTKVSPNELQDMHSTAGHIFLGHYYCHYGIVSNDQDCGIISCVNYPLVDYRLPGVTFFVSVGDSGMKCTGGDSGGPVWKPNYPNPSYPSGTIEGGWEDGRCLYMAVDDQLLNSGWSLQ